MLYKEIHDRQETQLAYKIKFYPWQELSDKAKELIILRRRSYFRKHDVVDMLDETMETFTLRETAYQIVWQYNNIPTREEWEKKSDGYLIHVDCRFSPALTKPVAIFSF